MNYDGQLYNNHNYAIKIRTGDDILNAANDAVCGELLAARGGQFPGLYIATKTSGDDVELCRISETIPENKLPIDHDYSLKFHKGDYLEFDSLLTMSGEFTLSYWFKPENEYEGVLFWGTLGQYINHYGPRYWNKLVIRNMGDQSTDEGSVIPGEWNHVFFTRDSDNISQIMLNGELASRAVNPHTDDISFNRISLPDNAASYEGLADEIVYWDSDQSENFSEIYNNGKPVDLSFYSPTHWWRMGDAENGKGSTIMDQGSGGNNLTIHGATFSKDTPYDTSSLQLSGTNNYLDTGSNFSDIFNKDFSISLWFKGTTQIGQNVYSYFAARDDSTPKDTLLWIMRINTNLSIRYRTDNTQNHDLTLSSPFPEDNEWHHLGLAVRQVDSDTQMILTFDGVSGSSVIRPMHMADFQNTVNFAIGARTYPGSGVPDSYLNGNIDEFSIFDRALSNTEMKAIYNNGKPANLYRHNPLHWWRMGENATTVRELNNYGSSAVNGYYMSDDRTPEIEDGDLFFDGVNDVVGLPPNIFNLGSDNFAISIWFKIDTPGTYGLLSIGNSLGRVSTIIMSDTSIRTSAYAPAHNIDNDVTVPQMATDTWHHFLWQKYGNSGGSQVKMYFNGVLVKDSILSSTTNFGADDLIYTGVGSSYEIASTIGFLAHWGGYYLDGGISEVAFWNNTLTDGGVSVGATAQGDIADIYNGGIVGKDISSYSPVHLWKPEREFITNKGRGDITPALVGPINYSFDTPSNTAPFTRYSLEFDGVDDSISTGLSVAGKSALTVSAWVNMPKIQDSGIVQQYAGTGTNRTFRVIHSHGKFWFQCYTVDGITEAEIDSSSVVTGEWFHIMGTFDGTTARIYLNNVAGTAGTTLTSTTLQTSSTNVEIGGSSGLNMFTEGFIDEVAILDVALANNERDYLYNNGKPGDISSLQPLGWWRMGDPIEGTFENYSTLGATIADQGSGGNDGTINGATFSKNTISSNLDFSLHSLRFDGVDDYLSTGVFYPSSIGTGNYSISWWFNVESGATVDHPYFFTFGGTSSSSADSTYQGCSLTQRSGDGYKLRISNHWDGSYIESVSSSTSDVEAGTWYHLLFVRSGDTITLWKNGVSIITLTDPNVALNNFSSASNFRIGYLQNSNSLFFKGAIDEFAIFDSALNSGEASYIYNNGSPRSLSNYSPLIWWRMEEIVDGKIPDEGSSRNYGTISGATLSTSIPRRS